MNKSVFVSVGTTKFDKLIQSVTDSNVLQTLSNLGYKTVVLQIGCGSYVPEASDVVDLSYYRYKDDIVDDIRSADLVISHCGAGTCLEVLDEEKPLVAVINEDLMDNHQLELARKLYTNGHILYCKCADLNDTLMNMNLQCLKPYPKGNPKQLADFLDKLFKR